MEGIELTKMDPEGSEKLKETSYIKRQSLSTTKKRRRKKKNNADKHNRHTAQGQIDSTESGIKYRGTQSRDSDCPQRKSGDWHRQ